MRLKALDIVGFKSFADRVHLTFGDGITGIVGPNGCGKSNVVDAIRWVMGEMSAKNLRGRGMLDVIFAGCETRGPSGLAEVTLTFRNDGDVPPIYASYEDISVTRRLHRDNSSEYLINKAPCRLRDITDLFLGTGVGTKAYSIIEQGRIGFVVSARPEDRRSLIEEVAGITKFKARRKAAERRMAATEQNLARVNDIISELSRQLASLQRQAKKAERYKRVKAELRDLDLHLASIQILELVAKDKVQAQAQLELDEQFGDRTRGMEIHETELEAQRLSHLAEEERLQEEQSGCAASEARLATLERDVSHWQQQIKDTRAQLERAKEDVEEALGRVGEVRSERESLAEHLTAMELSVREDKSRLAGAAASVGEIQAILTRVDEETEQLRRDALDLVHEAARHRTLLSNLETQRNDTESRQGRATADLEQTIRLGATADRYHQELEVRFTGIASELDDWRLHRESLGDELRTVTAEVANSEDRILELRTDLAESGSRLESLEGIAKRLEGYTEGVRALLNPEGDAEGPAVAGVLGLVTDVLRAQPRYERAIEAALGDKLQLVIVESHAVGMEAITYLKEQAGGRGGLLPKQPRSQTATPMPAAQTGLIGPALDCVKVEPGFEAAAEYLLANVAVVEDLPTALTIWDANGLSRTLVTLDGEVLDPAGAMSGGSEAGGGLLAQAREIRELRLTVSQLGKDLEAATVAHRELEARRLQLDVDIQQIDKEIRQGEVEQIQIDKELEAAANEIVRLADRLEVLDQELEQHHTELGRITREASESEEVATDAETRRAQLEARLAELQRVRAAHGDQLAGRSEALTALKVELASRDEKLVSSRDAIARLEQAEADASRRVERGRDAIQDGESLIAELTLNIENGEGEITTTASDVQTQRQSLSEARAAYEADRQQLADKEESLKETRKGSDAVREALVELKMDRQRLAMERQQVIALVAERHDVELLKVVGDYHLLPLPGVEDHEKRERLERGLKNIGPINLMAIEECEEVDVRHNFLVGQRDDLVQALDSLRRAIHRINRTSRRRFREAFEAVNQMFEKVFPRLFRGGEARLELLDHDDILEAGVDIVAQPPGKKLQNLSLLSGGEKALTATALIFAIFLIKPSPFCVLDEVDAPLDDANVRRFNEMLGEIAKISQFIVITHNKLTMTEATRLYGITMEEPGMSKLVSVDLSTAGSEQAA